MATFISHSPAETELLGQRWGAIINYGLVIALCGDLGAGKTQLVKGLAAGLGAGSRVHSPTFSLVNEYSGGRLKLFHLDLYRLDHREQIRGAGLEEYFNPDGVAVVEWAERWFECRTAPNGRLEPPQHFMGKLRWVRLEVLSVSERRIEYEDLGD